MGTAILPASAASLTASRTGSLGLESPKGKINITELLGYRFQLRGIQPNPALLRSLMSDAPVCAAHLLGYNPYWRKKNALEKSCTI